MKEFEILIHYIEQKISREDNDNLFELLKECLSEIDKDINNRGGILGLKCKTNIIKIKSDSYSIATEKEPKTLLPYLKKNRNILALHGSGPLQQKINTDKYIFIKTDSDTVKNLGKLKDTSIFYVGRTENNARVAFISKILKTRKDLNKVFFLHDGKKRLKSRDKDLKKLKPKKFFPLDFGAFKEQKNINSQLASLYKKVTNKDVILLDVNLSIFKNIFDYYNKNPNQVGLIILCFGTLEGRFKEINFPLIESKNLQTIYTPIGLQNLYNKTSIETDERLRELALSSVYRLDYPLLIKQASDFVTYKPNSRKEIVECISKSLSKINGKDDIFVGLRHVFTFKNNLNTIKDHYGYTFPKSLNLKGSFHKIFYDTQFFPTISEKVIKVNTNLINIDIVRITNINIAEGTWGCEFFLDISSDHKNPIEIIIFNNLSILNSKYEYKLIHKFQDEDSDNFEYRYYIVANLDFQPIADNYPFDWQHIFISYSISDAQKYGIIQPVPEVLLDKEFIVEGWKLRKAVTGIKRTKQESFSGVNLKRKVDVKEVARIGWTLSRQNYITLTKIAIPLTFLMFLNYYALFFDFEKNTRQLGILTTTFLSGIALYFSAERPQPLKLTTIDLIFIWYYIQSGVVIVTSAISSQLGEDNYYLSMNVLKIIAPLGLLTLIMFLYYRIKTVRLRPNIS